MKKILLIILLLLPSAFSLMHKGYISMHDDLQIMRLYEMQRCFEDGQIPCRWVPDMADGFGQPLFNFYSAFPYYLGSFIHMLFPVSYIFTAKLLFFAALLASGIGMFYLSKKFWGTWGAILSACLYVYAPYHALDIYVRGALSEAFALAILPFLWLSLYSLIQKPSLQKSIPASLAAAGLFTTHNLSTMLYAPFTVLWVIFFIIRDKRYPAIKYLIATLALAGGLSAFFLIPVIAEQQYIQTEFLKSDYYTYNAHFVSLRQLFLDRSWGFGASTFGDTDDISFQLGLPHWLSLLPFGFLLWKDLKAKNNKISLLLMLSGFFGISLFLTHQRSFFIWEKIPLLSFVQFPWRFLGLSIFFLSFSLGTLASPEIRFKKIITVVLIAITISLNIGYFRPEHYFTRLTDSEKLSGVLFDLQQRAAILDYLPKTAPTDPKEEAPSVPDILYGDAQTANYSVSSNRFFFDLVAYTESQISVPVIYYPGWGVIINGNAYPIKPGGAYGTIVFTVNPGKYLVQGRFEDTPLRFYANSLSLFSFSIIIIILAFTRVKHKVASKQYGEK